MTLLLLAGTSEARRLAARLALEGVPALASLAGVTREPSALALPTRRGGFGGDEGFSDFLDDHRIAAVIDATHPYAARITRRTHSVCSTKGVPLLRLERPGWSPREQDRWRFVANEAEAVARIPGDAVVFLATGRQSLPAWTGLRARRVYLRVIDPPTAALPFTGDYVVGRAPFDRASEAALFRHLGVTHLVAKDSGSADARPKLDAARDLGVEVILIRRPSRPEGLTVVETTEQALAWVKMLLLRSA